MYPHCDCWDGGETCCFCLRNDEGGCDEEPYDECVGGD